MGCENKEKSFVCPYCGRTYDEGYIDTMKSFVISDVYDIMKGRNCCMECARTLIVYERNKDNPLLFVIDGELYLYDKENIPINSNKGCYVYIRKGDSIIQLPRSYYFEDEYDLGVSDTIVKIGHIYRKMGIPDNASWSNKKEFEDSGINNIFLSEDDELVDLAKISQS